MRSPGILASALLTTALLAPVAAASERGPGRVGSPDLLGYFVEWGVYEKEYLPADLPAELLSHVVYAFLAVSDDDGDGWLECAVADPWAALEKPLERWVPGTDPDAGEDRGTLNQLRVLKRAWPHLRLVVSIGGWGGSDDLPGIAASAEARSRFAASCVELMRRHGFDGLDLDWEFPELADRDGLTALVGDLRSQLDLAGASDGADYELSVAVGPTPWHLEGVDLPAVGSLVDRVQVMAYDFHGPWDPVTGHNAPLCPSPEDPWGESWNAAGAVETWLVAGTPPEKIHLGVPYFGRGYADLEGAAGAADVFPGRFAGHGGGTVRGTWEDTGVFDYWDVVERYAGPFAAGPERRPGVGGYAVVRDPEQGVPWVYSGAPSESAQWLSYEDPGSAAAKAAWARSQGLGGVFVWELSQEGRPGSTEWPLTRALAGGLAGWPTAGTGPRIACGIGPSPSP